MCARRKRMLYGTHNMVEDFFGTTISQIKYEQLVGVVMNCKYEMLTEIIYQTLK